MDVGNMIFGVSAVVLCGVFLTYCIMLFRASRKIYIPIAYAGTVHDEVQSKSMVNSATITRLKNAIHSRSNDSKHLKAYMIKGNSMQFANIESGDIVFAEDCNTSTLINEFPKIVVLRHSAKEKGPTFKIRRAWRILPQDSDRNLIATTMYDVLSSKKFDELRELIGEKCPSNDVLISELLSKYDKLKANNKIDTLLLSTTYRSNEGKIGFSLHPVSSIAGVVVYVSTPVA